jgi:hypothetical protein
LRRVLSSKRFRIEKLITKIYESRSAFVHSGIEVPADHVEKVWPLVEAPVKALLRLQAKPHDRSPASIESWLAKLDYLYNCFAAAEIPPASKFIEYGLVPPPRD